MKDGLAAVVVLLTLGIAASCGAEPDPRETPAVRAAAATRPGVLDLQIVRRGQESFGAAAIVRVGEKATWALTANHVVAGAERIVARDAAGNRAEAVLRQADLDRDLALIAIRSAAGQKALQPGAAAEIRLAETVLAFGNSFGRGTIVTQGIVCRADAVLPLADGQKFRGLVQTDASLHAGMSGGPLVNLRGEWIALNLFVRTDDSGVGYALRIDQVAPLLEKWLPQR